MTALVNKIYMSGDWPKDFLDVTIMHYQSKTKHSTISLISHT